MHFYLFNVYLLIKVKTSARHSVSLEPFMRELYLYGQDSVLQSVFNHCQVTSCRCRDWSVQEKLHSLQTWWMESRALSWSSKVRPVVSCIVDNTRMFQKLRSVTFSSNLHYQVMFRLYVGWQSIDWMETYWVLTFDEFLWTSLENCIPRVPR